MEDFVIHYGVDLQRGESGIPRCCDKEEESSCVMSVGATTSAKGRGCGRCKPAKGSLIRILRDVLWTAQIEFHSRKIQLLKDFVVAEGIALRELRVH
jgi:hypothetical protein